MRAVWSQVGPSPWSRRRPEPRQLGAGVGVGRRRDRRAVRRTVSVTEDGRPVSELNELEYVKGEIYANVWQTDRIVRIDPKTGNLTGTIDLTGLLPQADRDADTDVLNGIAYDEAGDRLFVTGKLWSKLFEIRLVKK